MYLNVRFFFIAAAFICRSCQADSGLELEKVESVFLNQSYIAKPKLNVTVDKDLLLIESKGTALKDYGTNVTLAVQVYKLSNGVYETFPLSITVNVCDEWSRNTLGVKDFVSKYSNAPPACPIKKGRYRVRKGQFDLTIIPPQAPPGSYKVQGKVYNNDDLVMEGNVYGRLG